MSSVHDRLFRAVLGKPGNAAGELRAVLPRELAEQIDFETLAPVDSSFVGKRLKEQRCDLLFEARLRGGGAIYVLLLLEHKSWQDPMTAVQVMSYMGEVWLRHHRDQPGPVSPAIVPVLLYHGEKPWREALGPQQRLHLAGLDAASRVRVLAGTPSFVMHVENLPALPIEAVLERDMAPGARLVLFCASWFSNPRDSTAARRLCADAFLALSLVPGGDAEVTAICVYLHELRETKPDLIDKFIHEYMDEETMKTFTSIEDKFRAEGRSLGKAEGKAEGRAEGKAEGKAEILTSQLTARFGDLPASIRERIRVAAPADLDAWAIRVLTAERLEQVFG